jgi:hypothetical protein
MCLEYINKNSSLRNPSNDKKHYFEVSYKSITFDVISNIDIYGSYGSDLRHRYNSKLNENINNSSLINYTYNIDDGNYNNIKNFYGILPAVIELYVKPINYSPYQSNKLYIIENYKLYNEYCLPNIKINKDVNIKIIFTMIFMTCRNTIFGNNLRKTLDENPCSIWINPCYEYSNNFYIHRELSYYSSNIILLNYLQKIWIYILYTLIYYIMQLLLI